MVSCQFTTTSRLVNQKASMMDASKPFTPRALIKKGYFMKMKHFFLTLLISGLSILTYAQSPLSIKFNDADYNYYGGLKDIKTGYIHLGYDSGTITVTLSEEVSPLKVQYAEMKQALDTQGKKKAWKKNDIADYVKINSFADGVHPGVTILHNDAYLDSVMSAYNTALTQLGFSSTPEASYPNTKVLIYNKDSGALKVLFTRLGRQVTVRMTAL
jgi:hypothetical protein